MRSEIQKSIYSIYDSLSVHLTVVQCVGHNIYMFRSLWDFLKIAPGFMETIFWAEMAHPGLKLVRDPTLKSII